MEKLYLGLILHLIGDYLTQNNFIANNKVKSNKWALVHVTMYSLPFLTICFSWYWLILFSTHYFIDRYRLAVYWIKLVNWNWKYDENYGFPKEVPSFMSIWLMFIIDNIFHIMINSACIYLTNYT